MAEAKPGFLTRAFGAIDLTRRIVLNLIFVLILVVILVALFTSGPAKLKDKTTLIIDLKGVIVEQYSGDPTQRAIDRALGGEVNEVRLRDIRRVLKLAAKDPKITAVLLRPDSLAGAGVATLREVARSITDFRATGKEIYSYAYAYDQRALYLAAHTNRVYLHPEGLALLEGLGRYRIYYKDLLDKLGVKMHVFRVGEFKSAVEPYLLNGPSPEAREADAYWLESLWTQLLEDYAKARGLDVADLRAMIDELPARLQAAGNSPAQLALSEKLVDELMTPDELRKLLIEKGTMDEANKTFRQVRMADYLKRNPELPVLGDHVGIIVAEGAIVNGEQPQGTIGGESVAQLVRQARNDDKVKAIVLRVDSPGGSGFASELIRRELQLAKEAGKPVVISMGDLAASGGYWISMTSDMIISEPTTITGSIGIFGLFPDVSAAADKIGVHSDGTTTTWLAGAMDIARPLDPKLGEVIQSAINHGYQNFIGKVAESRGKTVEEIDTIARGRVWSGAQALERGLVDQLGSFDDAIAKAAELAKLGTDYQVAYIEKPKEGLEAFLEAMSGSAARAFVQALGLSSTEQRLLGQARQDLKFLEGHEQRPFAIYAHCFCEVQ
jgi:protease-4